MERTGPPPEDEPSGDRPPDEGPQSPAGPPSPQSPGPQSPGPQGPGAMPPGGTGGPPPPPPGPQSPGVQGGPTFPPAPPGPATGPQSPGGYTGPVPPGGWSRPPATSPGVGGAALASWGSRLGAYLIDGLVIAIPAGILFFLLVGGAAGITGNNEDVAIWAVIGATLLWIVLVALIYLMYAPALMARAGSKNGQTWGKQALNIRVVRNSGQPYTFASAALREVVLKFLAVGIASSIIPLIPWFVNYFWPLWDDENRALHDMAASSHVVRA